MHFSSIAQQSVPMFFNSIPRRIGFITKYTKEINKLNDKAANENKNRENTMGKIYKLCIHT